MTEQLLFQRKEALYELCATRHIQTFYDSEVNFEYAGDCGMKVLTPVQLQLKSRLVINYKDIADITAIHILRSGFRADELRNVLPQLQSFGTPIYIYSTLNDFKSRAVECANSIEVHEEPTRKFRLFDPVLDVHSWLHILEAATKSRKALSALVESPQSKHVKELIKIIQHTKGSSHAYMTLKSRLHQKLENIEQYGDVNAIDMTEYRECQQLRELMTRQGLSVSKLPEFLYMAIRNIRLRDHTI